MYSLYHHIPKLQPVLVNFLPEVASNLSYVVYTWPKSSLSLRGDCKVEMNYVCLASRRAITAYLQHKLCSESFQREDSMRENDIASKLSTQ